MNWINLAFVLIAENNKSMEKLLIFYLSIYITLVRLFDCNFQWLFICLSLCLFCFSMASLNLTIFLLYSLVLRFALTITTTIHLQNCFFSLMCVSHSISTSSLSLHSLVHFLQPFIIFFPSIINYNYSILLTSSIYALPFIY